jgi:plastocyanin
VKAAAVLAVLRSVAFCLGLVAVAGTATAQPLTERSPNLEGTWVTAPRNLHFQFAHRFEMAGQDVDIGDIFGDGVVVNYPTFALTYGAMSGLMVGVRYSSKSLVMRGANEWQPYLKWAPLPLGRSAWSLSVKGAYNGSAKSADGDLATQVELWNRLIVLGSVRGFTNTFGTDTASLALGIGAGVRLNRYVTLAGDIADMVLGLENTPLAWSAGVHLGIPHTPHTFSLMATNVTSGTLQGTATGVSGEVFWGFEFTVPFSGFARWGKILDPGDAVRATRSGTGARGSAEPGSGVVIGSYGNAKAIEIDIESFRFEEAYIEIPEGTTVRWVNRDPVAHTTTSDEGRWGSPFIGPGETFEVTFLKAGEYAYHCAPHPFMEAMIRVVGR